jgi:hypothetical protein
MNLRLTGYFTHWVMCVTLLFLSLLLLLYDRLVPLSDSGVRRLARDGRHTDVERVG